MDELLNEVCNNKYLVFFQFDNDEPIELAIVENGHRFVLTLDASDTDEPCVTFSNGNKKEFKFFMRKCF